MIRKTLLALILFVLTIGNIGAQNNNFGSDWNLDGNPIQGNNTSYSLPEDGVVRVALLLPFLQGSKNVPADRIIEYYEGFLLAVQELKEKGLNAEIYTFDIDADDDTQRLESILSTNELNNLNLIIGGVSEKQVQLISDFSRQTGVKHVVPFSNKDTGVEDNINMFQVANSPTNLFPKIIQGFTITFADANIIFLDELASDRNKAKFVEDLQNGLKEANIAYHTAPSSASIIDDLNTVIDRSKQNIIVPTSSSEGTLTRILDAMPIITKNQARVSLFGYPEWQAYVNQAIKMHQFNSYMYSMFYLDVNQPEALAFAGKYRTWYNKSFIPSIPKYAHMGYDTGLVFLSAAKKYGSDFASRIKDIKINTLQSALYFEPVSFEAGYINTGVYFINLRPNGTVVKTDISKL